MARSFTGARHFFCTLKCRIAPGILRKTQARSTISTKTHQKSKIMFSKIVNLLRDVL
jgi:hypothetical protein